jgi:hypothetical protein
VFFIKAEIFRVGESRQGQQSGQGKNGQKAKHAKNLL